ncbi:MAG TPA: alpha-glucuronidase family glycosyl hydrolase, partial [Steroidobacteraceae bacterium]|nr:alpha-glucuronidase family glycosyl hydrolase [Steroidobacteraceae bacterium]
MRLHQALLTCALLACTRLHAEDGYDLWLRYPAVADARLAQQYRAATTELVVGGATGQAARAEIERGLRGMLGAAPPLTRAVTRDGAILLGTPATLPQLRRLPGLAALGPEGYILRTVTLDGHRTTV